MYQSLITNLKKILEGKDTADKKLLKIQTLVDFAAGLEKQPQWPTMPNARDRVVGSPYQETPQPLQATKPTAGPGAIVGVEDIK